MILLVNIDGLKDVIHHFMIPYARNDAFISRSIVEQFEKKLGKAVGHQRMALWGLGGVGYVL